MISLRNGVIVELIAVLGVSLGALLFIFLSLFTGIDDIITTINGDVIEPSIDELKANILLMYITDDGYGKTIDMLSVYASTSDASYKSAIESRLAEMFSEQRVDIRLGISGVGTLSNGVDGVREASEIVRKITLHDGSVKNIEVAFYA